jgi:hypothetical protein
LEDGTWIVEFPAPCSTCGESTHCIDLSLEARLCPACAEGPAPDLHEVFAWPTHAMRGDLRRALRLLDLLEWQATGAIPDPTLDTQALSVDRPLLPERLN